MFLKKMANNGMETKFSLSNLVILVILLLPIACSKESPPELSISDASLLFTTYPDTKPLIISNTSEGELSWEIPSKPSWVEISKSSGKISTDVDTVMITVDIDQAIGTYSGTLSIISNGGNENVTITLTIGIWQERTPMITKRSASGAVEVGGKIYVIGGLQTEDLALSNVEVYDPVENKWIKKTPMPTARGAFGCVAVDGKIYAIGGADPNIIATVEVYDPATDSWATKTPMPAPRAHVAASSVGDKIYVIGGSEQIGSIWSGLNKVEEYDTRNDSWSIRSNMPHARWSLSSCVADGKIYAIGGNHYPESPTICNYVEVYDPETNTWIEKNNMPTSRYSLSCSFVNDKIYAIGGWYGSGTGPLFKTVEEYDTNSDTWKQKTYLPFETALLSTCAVNGKIFAIGGTTTIHPFTSVNNVYVYDPGSDQ
jgi:N-acetylneuraminic acid mutarotase